MEISKSITSELISKLHKLNLMLLSGEKHLDYPMILLAVAENAKDFLGADLVDLYEYDQSNDCFNLPPIMVGDRHERYVTKEKVYKDDVIVKVLKQNRPLYMVEAQKAKKVTEKYSVPRFDAPIERFVVREQIYSSVAVPLISRNEKVGLLFINYRSHQQFEKEQKDAIELFASLAALVILNSRLEIANRKIKHIESKDSKDFIFISYVREDLDRVLPIYQKLIERGHKAWLDVEELLPGQDWDQEIQEIIKESKVFVACLSNRSVSKKGYFQKELKKGFDIYEEYPEGHIFMIPVILEECNIPTRFEKIQWCNLKNDDGFDKLFKAVEKSLGK